MAIESPIKNGVLIIDDQDVDLLDRPWYATNHKNTKYAAGRSRKTKKIEYVHRLIAARIIGGPIPRSHEIDHIDGNGLDNRRCNLRVCTHQENMRHRTRVSSKNRSGVLGVFWSDSNQGWCAQITIGEMGGERQRLHLGTFKTVEEAAAARNHAEIEHYGDFAPKRMV